MRIIIFVFSLFEFVKFPDSSACMKFIPPVFRIPCILCSPATGHDEVYYLDLFQCGRLDLCVSYTTVVRTIYRGLRIKGA